MLFLFTHILVLENEYYQQRICYFEKFFHMQLFDVQPLLFAFYKVAGKFAYIFCHLLPGKWRKDHKIYVDSCQSTSLLSFSVCLSFCDIKCPQVFSLKGMSTTFLLVFFVSQKDSLCGTKKNSFYFTLRALFVPEIIKF